MTRVLASICGSGPVRGKGPARAKSACPLLRLPASAGPAGPRPVYVRRFVVRPLTATIQRLSRSARRLTNAPVRIRAAPTTSAKPVQPGAPVTGSRRGFEAPDPVVPAPPGPVVPPVPPVVPPVPVPAVVPGVGVAPVVAGEQLGLVMVLVSRVTAPLRASVRPSTVAPVVTVMEVNARMLPRNVEPVPSVAELPICQ